MPSESTDNEASRSSRRDRRHERRNKDRSDDRVFTYYNATSTILFLAFGLDVASSARFQFFKNWDQVELFYQIGMVATVASIVIGIVLKLFFTYGGKSRTGVFFSIASLLTTALVIIHTLMFIKGYIKYKNVVDDKGENSNEAREIQELYLVNGDKRDHLVRCILAIGSSILYALTFVLSCCMSCCGKV